MVTPVNKRPYVFGVGMESSERTGSRLACMGGRHSRNLLSAVRLRQDYVDLVRSHDLWSWAVLMLERGERWNHDGT